MKAYLAFSAILLAAGSLAAQDFKLPSSLDALAARASETVEVNLDQRMLQLASKFLAKDEDDEETKRIIKGLKAIYVRSYEFAKPGEYNPAELEPVRAQLLKDNQWSRIVGVRSQRDGENLDVFVRAEGDHFTGMWVLSTEPKELVVVNIQGPIDINSLAGLGGQFGIPKVKRQAAKKEATR
jgi:Domain of unknown function (DUF4252)